MNKKGEYQYLLMAFILIFVVGSLTFIVSSFTDVSLYNYDGYLAPVIDFVQNGYNFVINIPIPILPDLNLDFNFNPFGILGGNIQNFLVEQLTAFALLPEIISIPLIIVITSSFIYFIIKIIQGFIP